MTRKLAGICGIMAMVLLPVASTAQIRINEFMANNVSTFPDNVDFDDFSDWIELYNEGSAEADIGGYYVTGDLKQTKKWQIPSGVTIPAKGFLLIWADDNNAKPGAKGTHPWYSGGTFTVKRCHANFCLDKEGEQVGLFSASGAVADSFTYPAQFADVSMGRTTDGSWGFFDEPTPEVANSTTPKKAGQFAGNVTFSVAGGFYGSAQTVTLTASDGSAIYYTTDCSIPFTTDTKYAAPVPIGKTTILRARCIAADKFAGKVATNSYFINEKARKVMVVSIAGEPKFLFDKTIGIYKNSLKGREVPVSIEFFTTDGKLAVKANAGMRLGSLTNYEVAQKPLQIALRNRYGDPFVEYQFYAKPAKKFDRFRLRDGGDAFNSSIINDALLDPVCSGQTALGIQGFRLTVVYINGEYYGIQDLREQFKDMYFSENYGIAAPEKRDEVRSMLLNSSGSMAGGGEGWELVNGTWDSKKSLVSQLRSGTIDASKYKQLQGIVDIASLTDFFALVHFGKAISWGHNQDMWTVSGGKWRWLVTDFDRAFVYQDTYTKIDHNPFTTAAGVSPKMSDDTVLTKMLTNADFKNYYVQRCAAHMNSTFKTSRLNAIVDSIADIYDLEMADHVAKWGSLDGVKSVAAWKEEVDLIKKFMTDRPKYVWEHLAATPFSATGGRAELTVKIVPADAKADILVNGVPLTQGLAGISLFKGIPFQIKAVGKPGWKCSGWEGGDKSDSMNVTLTGVLSVTVNFTTVAVGGQPTIQPATAIPEASVHAESGNHSIIFTFRNMDVGGANSNAEVFNLSGRRIALIKKNAQPKIMHDQAILYNVAAGVYYYSILIGSSRFTGMATVY